jgi:small subunit ribosomal protein S20
LKTAVKSLLQAIDSKETTAIPSKLRHATSIIAKTESKGILKKNTAARKISRLTKRANVTAQA